MRNCHLCGCFMRFLGPVRTNRTYPLGRFACSKHPLHTEVRALNWKPPYASWNNRRAKP